MTTDTNQRLAKQLRAAYREGPIPSLREQVSPNDIESAYAIQAINTRFWDADGRTRSGRKIGLTARAVQKQLGVDQPDFGVLFEDMQVRSGGMLPSILTLQPKAEAEVALVLSDDVSDENATPETIAAVVAHALPAIEIVDSRIANWEITFADTVADNGSAAYYVLGEAPRALQDLDLWTCGMVLEVNDEVVSVGAGAACLGHPLRAAAWLARTLAARGDRLRKGEVIMTGALGPMAPIRPGDHVRASIGGLGACSFTLAENAG